MNKTNKAFSKIKEIDRVFATIRKRGKGSKKNQKLKKNVTSANRMKEDCHRLPGTTHQQTEIAWKKRWMPRDTQPTKT